MTSLKRFVSSLLFGAGIVLVFAGLSTALGLTAAGMLASVAAITALLYAGAVWFGTPPPNDAPVVLVFDEALRVSGGPMAGQAVAAQFPSSMRREIQRHCEAAVRGEYSRFTCHDGVHARTFDAAPVMSVHRSVVCGVLVEGAAIPAPAVSAAPALSSV